MKTNFSIIVKKSSWKIKKIPWPIWIFLSFHNRVHCKYEGFLRKRCLSTPPPPQNNDWSVSSSLLYDSSLWKGIIQEFLQKQCNVTLAGVGNSQWVENFSDELGVEGWAVLSMIAVVRLRLGYVWTRSQPIERNFAEYKNTVTELWIIEFVS